MILTLDKMRADVAALIDLKPEEVGTQDNLWDLGLDSLRLMRLLLTWEEAGVKADFARFAEHSTLGDWWAEVVAPGAAA